MPSFISWVPTPEEDMDTFFQLAPVSPSDVVYDLGSGDGRLVFAALEKGAKRAIGIDIDPVRVSESREIAKTKNLGDRVIFIEADVMDIDLSDATLIFCYLITAASAALKPKFASELKKGTRIVMESFPVPGWKPSEIKNFGYKTFYLYKIPPEMAE
jgi:ribosomal protein L11 methylase PrmA